MIQFLTKLEFDNRERGEREKRESWKLCSFVGHNDVLCAKVGVVFIKNSGPEAISSSCDPKTRMEEEEEWDERKWVVVFKD